MSMHYEGVLLDSARLSMAEYGTQWNHYND